MTKRPNVSQALALKVAAAAAAQDEPEEQATPEPTIEAAQEDDAEATPRPRGRPRGRRDVAARITVYLDERRHAALTRLAEDRGRSVHSIIIEGIDLATGKPMKSAWD